MRQKCLCLSTLLLQNNLFKGMVRKKFKSPSKTEVDLVLRVDTHIVKQAAQATLKKSWKTSALAVTQYGIVVSPVTDNHISLTCILIYWHLLAVENLIVVYSLGITFDWVEKPTRCTRCGENMPFTSISFTLKTSLQICKAHTLKNISFAQFEVLTHIIILG